MEYKIYKTDDELIHWGIKGMKWGQRRYQNKDGSLTPAGQKRYQKEMAALKKEEQVLKNRKATQAKINRLEAKRKSIEDQKKGKSSADVESKKSVKDMSDEELIYAVNRARLEDTYRQLRPEQTPQKNNFMNKMLNEVVAPAAINSGKKFLEDALNKVGKNLLGNKVDPDSIEALTKKRDKLKLKKEINDYEKGDPDLDDIVEKLNGMSDEDYERLVRAANVKFYLEGVKNKGVKPDKNSNKKKDDDDTEDDD